MQRLLQEGEYFGNEQRKLLVNGLILTESLFKPYQHLSTHSHSNSYICYILKGSYMERTDEGEFQCEKNDVIFHMEGTSHENRFHKQPSICFNIEFMPHWFNSVKAKGIHFLRPIKIYDPAVTILIQKIYKEFIDRRDLCEVYIEAMVMELLVLLKRRMELPANKTMHTLLDLLHARFSETITIQDLSKKVNLHPSHLSRAFKRWTGMTIGEYQRNLKITYATGLLLTTQKDLFTVSMESGFTDQSHFSRCFKVSTGYTPTGFKKKMQVA